MDTSPGTIPTPDAAPRRAPRRLYRSSSNRVFSGVCAGVAEYFGGDPTMVRLATAILGLITGIIPMTILYIVAAIVVPERGPADMQEPVGHARPATAGNGALIVGMVFIAIGLAGFAREVLQVDWDLIWPFALIGIGAAFAAHVSAVADLAASLRCVTVRWVVSIGDDRSKLTVRRTLADRSPTEATNLTDDARSSRGMTEQDQTSHTAKDGIAATDTFLADLPDDTRAALEALRQVIRAAAPDAVETIAYSVPAFKYKGRPLVSFSAGRTGKGPCAFYVQSPELMGAHRDELREYDTSKGTIRFQPGEPLPVDLVTRLVKARMAQTDAARNRPDSPVR